MQRCSITIQSLRCDTIIGIYPEEKMEPQPLLLDITFALSPEESAPHEAIEKTVDYHCLSKGLVQYVNSRRFLLIETVAQEVLRYCCEHAGERHYQVRVTKPNAMPEAKAVCIELEHAP